MRATITGPRRAIHRNAATMWLQGARAHVSFSAPGRDAHDSGDALIDSGSHMSAIDALLVPRLGLASTESEEIATIGGSISAKLYFTRLNSGGIDLGVYHCAAVDGLVRRGLMALLGRDVLHQRVLTYDGCRGVYRLRSPDAVGRAPVRVPEEIFASDR